MTRDEFIQKAAIAMAGNNGFTDYGKLLFSNIANNAKALANRMDEEVDWD
jgi:hypothetical protein